MTLFRNCFTFAETKRPVFLIRLLQASDNGAEQYTKSIGSRDHSHYPTQTHRTDITSGGDYEKNKLNRNNFRVVDS